MSKHNRKQKHNRRESEPDLAAMIAEGASLRVMCPGVNCPPASWGSISVARILTRFYKTIVRPV